MIVLAVVVSACLEQVDWDRYDSPQPAGGQGGAAVAPDQTCWKLPLLCYCGPPSAVPGGVPGIDYQIVAQCDPPASPTTDLEWCCDDYAGVCRCWPRQPGECQYWRDEGSWVAGCAA
jgi:hypothetical protein